jgi:hypothetical protein
MRCPREELELPKRNGNNDAFVGQNTHMQRKPLPCTPTVKLPNLSEDGSVSMKPSATSVTKSAKEKKKQ